MSHHPGCFIFQGEAGDCWFLSSLCSFANYVTKKKEEGNDDELLDRVVQSKFQLAGDRGLFCGPHIREISNRTLGSFDLM